MNERISTPWGMSDTAYQYTEGMRFYGTPSHGGFKLSHELNMKIPAVFRIESGWYEEDCAYNIPMYFFFDEIVEFFRNNPNEWTRMYSTGIMDHFRKYNRQTHKDSLKRWETGAYAVYFNEDLEEWYIQDGAWKTWETPETLRAQYRKEYEEAKKTVDQQVLQF